MLGEGLWASDRLACFTEPLEAALLAEFPEQAHSGSWCLIKDPRQCRLQQIWNQLIARHHLECVVVLVNRLPLAVVASLQRREQIPSNRALLLWIQHQLEAERHTRDYPRRSVTYEAFIENPTKVLDGIVKLLGDSQLNSLDQLEDLVQPELNHAADQIAAPGEDLDDTLLQLALEVYSTLRSSSRIDQKHQLNQLNQKLQQHSCMLRSQIARMTTLQQFWQQENEPGFSERDSLRCSINVVPGPRTQTFRLPDLT